MSLFDGSLRSWVRSDPDRVILTCTERHKTAAQLEDRIGRFASVLRRDLKLRPGDLIALVSLGTDYFLEAFLAAVRAGLVVVLVNWRWSLPEAARALAICKPRALILDAFCLNFKELRAAVSSIGPIVLIGDQPGSVSGLLLAEDSITSTCSAWLTAAAEVHQPAVICFTSGSTGLHGIFFLVIASNMAVVLYSRALIKYSRHATLNIGSGSSRCLADLARVRAC